MFVVLVVGSKVGMVCMYSKVDVGMLLRGWRSRRIGSRVSCFGKVETRREVSS
jgi:hypothetical protein